MNLSHISGEIARDISICHAAPSSRQAHGPRARSDRAGILSVISRQRTQGGEIKKPGDKGKWQARRGINDDFSLCRSRGTCSVSSGCLGAQWRGDDERGRSRSEPSGGRGVDRKLNAPTAPRPQTNAWMSDSAAGEREDGGQGRAVATCGDL